MSFSYTRTVSRSMALLRSSPRSFSSPSPENPKKLFVLTYEYVENVAEKRAPLRASHLAYAKDMVAKGVLLAGGAFNPLTHGMLIINGTRDDADNLAKRDPYVVGKIVKNYDIKEWTVVIGDI